MLKITENENLQLRRALPWAEFLISSCRDCFNFIRDEHLFNIPSCFKECRLETIREKWELALSRMREGKIPLEIGLEIVWPPYSGITASNLDSQCLDLLRKEIDQFGGMFRGIPFSTLSIGDGITSGGAISCLSDDRLDDFLRYAKKNFNFSKDVAVSIKGSIGTLSRSKFDILVQHGLCRLVLDIQDLHQDRETFADRKSEILEALSATPWVTLDIDIALGLKDQTSSSIANDIGRALSFHPHTIYVYLFGGAYKGAAAAQEFPNPRMGEAQLLDIADRLICRSGYRHQVDDADYLTLHPWEEKQIRAKKKRRASVLGLGYGSLSHAFGSAWYCHPAMRIDDIRAEDIPMYFCLDSSMEDEMRGYAIGALSQTLKISRKSFKSLFKKDVLESGALEKPLMEFHRLGLIQIDAEFVRWSGTDSMQRALWLKRLHNPEVIRSIFAAQRPVILSFVDRFEKEEVPWREMAMGRQGEQDAIAYWNPARWNGQT